MGQRDGHAIENVAGMLVSSFGLPKSCNSAHRYIWNYLTDAVAIINSKWSVYCRAVYAIIKRYSAWMNSQYAPRASLCVRADRHIRQIIAVKSTPMPTDTPQLEFWSHVQSERTDLFHGSKSRLDYLLRRSEKFAGGRSLVNIGSRNGYL